MSAEKNIDFELDLEELNSAEDFLEYFEIEFDEKIVHVNRLHILQRLHDYLSKKDLNISNEEKYEMYKILLTKAYEDFIKSDAQTEKVFKVFHMNEPQETFVPLDSLKL